MQQDNEDQKYDNRRAWLRWAVASGVGGVVSGVVAYVGTDFLVNYFHPEPLYGIDTGGAFVVLMSWSFSITIGGVFGGLAHWSIVEQRYRRQLGWIKAWTALFWLIMIPISLASEAAYVGGVEMEDVLEALVVRVGLVGMSVIIGAPLGLVIGSVLRAMEYVRSRRQAPGA